MRQFLLFLFTGFVVYSVNATPLAVNFTSPAKTGLLSIALRNSSSTPHTVRKTTKLHSENSIRTKRIANGQRISHNDPRSMLVIAPLPIPKPLPIKKPSGPDPIRFLMQANKPNVAVGEEFEITITAELLPILPSQIFFFEAQRSFSLHVLMPEGFIQTGGNYYNGITGRPTLSESVKITLSGYFQHKNSPDFCFRLLRRTAQPEPNELYNKVGMFCLPVTALSPVARDSSNVKASSGARAGTGNLIGNLDIANCSYFKGWILDQGNPGVSQYITLSIDGTQYGPILADYEWPAIRDGNFPNHPYTKYGFLWPVPASLNDGRIHTVNLFATATGKQFATTVSSFGLGDLTITANVPPKSKSLRLKASATASREVVNYNWQGPNNFTSTLQNPSVGSLTTAVNGLYSVTATTPSGCSASVSANIKVPIYEGRLDEVYCDLLKGWARDVTNYQQPTRVYIYMNDALVDSVATTLARPDVGSAATYGYQWSVPTQYRQGTHKVQVRDLNGYPLLVSGTANTTATIGINSPISTLPPPAAWVFTDGLISRQGNSYTLCEGSGLGLGRDANTPGTPTWNGPGLTATPPNVDILNMNASRQGIYIYRSVMADGCTQSTSVSVTIAAQYEANLEDVNCTFIKGWLVNQLCRDKAATLQIRIDNIVVATLKTDQKRTEVRDTKAPGSSFADYGFRWEMPAQWQVGSHTLRITDLNNNDLVPPRTYGLSPIIPWVWANGQGARKLFSYTICEGSSIGLGQDANTPGTSTWSGPSLTATAPNVDIHNMNASRQGTYTYRSTTADGCSQSTSVSITVTTVPSPSVNNVTICAGTSATLLASGCAGTVNWLFTNATGYNFTTPALTQTTTYSATCTQQSCTSRPAAATVTIRTPLNKPALSANPGTISSPRSVTLNATGCANLTQWQWAAGTAKGTNVTVTVGQTTSFTARCQSPDGCFSDPAWVTVNYVPVPIPTVSASTTLLCGDQSVTLQAEGCPNETNILWSNGMTGSPLTFVPTSTTSYSAKCILDGNKSNSSPAVQVSIRPTPTITGALNYTTGETISLTATSAGATSYSWRGSNNYASTGDILRILGVGNTHTGSYTVTANYSGEGCMPYAVAQITVNKPTLRTGTITPSSVCAGSTLAIPFVWAGNFGPGNTFTVQLSDSSGNFVSPISIGTGSTSPINVMIPAATLAGSNYRIRVVSSDPVLTDTQSPASLTIGVPPSVTASSNSLAGEVSWGDSLRLNVRGENLTGATYQWSGPSSFSSTQANPIVPNTTLANSGTYTVAVTSPGGCSATAITTVVIGNPLTATISGNLSICAGQSTTLTASGGSRYRWSTGEQSATIVVAPTSATVYSVTVTNANGASATATKNVTVSSAPSLTITGKANLCAGESTTLTANGADNYLWSTGDIGSQIVVTPTQSTTSSVWSMGEQGCLGEATGVVQVTSFSMTASGSANGQSFTSSNKGQTASLAQGATVVLSAAVDGVSPKDLIYNWSGPNNFTSTAAKPSFRYTSEAQMGTYQVVAQTPEGCTSGARVGIGTAEDCNLSLVVYNKANLSSIISNEQKLSIYGCPGEYTLWNGTNGTENSNGTYTWADGETGRVERGSLGQWSVYVTPQATKTYIAICTLASGKICTTSAEVKVSSAGCANLQITASATTYQKGDVITLTAANCVGTLTWSQGLGSASSVKISPTSDLIVSAYCTSETKTCYSNAIPIRNLSCLRAIYTNWTGFNNTVQLGYYGCETGQVNWSVKGTLCSATSSNGFYTLEGITGEVSVSATCNRAGEATCPTLVKTINGSSLVNCANYYVHVETASGTPVNLLGIKSGHLFTLKDEANVSLTDTLQNPVYVPVATKEKLYTATFPNGCTSSVKVTPATFQLYWKENIVYNGKSGEYEVGTGDPWAPKKVVESFDLSGYKPYNEYYAIDLQLTPVCPGKIIWTSSAEPTGSQTTRILSLRTSEFLSDPSTTKFTAPQYHLFPIVPTTYYAACQVEQDGTTVTYPAVNSKQLVITSNSCLQIANLKAIISQGESVQLKVSGCLGMVNWSLAGVSVGQGTTLTHTPLPNTAPATVEYVASCSNPVCSEKASVRVNTCLLRLTASKTTSKVGESVELTAMGCSGGSVRWNSGDVGTQITVGPMETATYTASCVVGGNTLCSDAISITTENEAPDKEECPAFQLVSSTTSIVRCSNRPVVITPTGCPAGGTITWSDGSVTGPDTPYKITLSETATIGATCRTRYKTEASQEVTITAREPELTVSGTQVTPGFPAILRASGCFNAGNCQPGTYRWLDENGNLLQAGSTMTVTVWQPTTYKLTCNNSAPTPVRLTLKPNCAIPGPIMNGSRNISTTEYFVSAAWCDVTYPIRWRKASGNSITELSARNDTRSFVVTRPAMKIIYGSNGDVFATEPQSDAYYVSCVQNGSLCVFLAGTAGSYDPSFPDLDYVPAQSGPVNTPGPCGSLINYEKGGIPDKYARNPGDIEQVYLLYTDWCPGQLKWFQQGKELTSLRFVTVSGPPTQTFTYLCTLTNGQPCSGEFQFEQQPGGRLAASTQLLSRTVSNNCSTPDIALKDAMEVYLAQMLCQLSELFKDQNGHFSRELALSYVQKLMAQMQSSIPWVTLSFPTDLTPVVDALQAGHCEQAGALLASAMGGQVAKTTYNQLILPTYSQVMADLTRCEAQPAPTAVEETLSTNGRMAAPGIDYSRLFIAPDGRAVRLPNGARPRFFNFGPGWAQPPAGTLQGYVTASGDTYFAEIIGRFVGYRLAKVPLCP
ncbi:hypothetical protein, partial [Spirosoma flavus]